MAETGAIALRLMGGGGNRGYRPAAHGWWREPGLSLCGSWVVAETGAIALRLMGDGGNRDYRSAAHGWWRKPGLSPCGSWVVAETGAIALRLMGGSGNRGYRPAVVEAILASFPAIPMKIAMQSMAIDSNV